MVEGLEHARDRAASSTFAGAYMRDDTAIVEIARNWIPQDGQVFECVAF